MAQNSVTRRFAATAAATGVLAAYTVANARGGPEPKVAQGTIHSVLFPMGSAELHPEDLETIHSVAAMMERNPALIAVVTTKVGTPDFNQHLSWRRAAAIFETLVFKYGVAATRVEIRWTDERLQIAPTGDQTAGLQDRVVYIVLHEKQTVCRDTAAGAVHRTD